jgi:hypothetical protein
MYSNTAGVFSEGVFKKTYLEQGRLGSDFRSANVLCTSLFSSSGWKDGKFYMLINDITPGTVVKVTYLQKSVYCKVLGPISDTIRYANINVIINSAAADMLGMTHVPERVDIFYPINVSKPTFANQ